MRRADAAIEGTMTAQTGDLFKLRLRAMDGLREGASRREVAIGLFGARRVPAGLAWKSSELRSLIYRLVADAHALSRGGYIRLLR